MELKNLYTVKKIMETGNYQRAAQALNYAQSTITFQMKQLEEELSIHLFEKQGNKMQLTAEGAKILPLIDKVLLAVEELNAFNKRKDELTGTLKIALPETLLTYKLQDVLKKFKEQAPAVKLSLQVMNCYAIYEHMMDNTIDIAIHYDVRKYSSNIVTKAMYTYPLVLVASPDLPKTQRDFLSPNQRKPICHIQNDPNALYLKIFNQYLQKKNIILETALELWSIESIKNTVRSNLGVAYLPRFTVEEELSQGLFVELETAIENNAITAIYAYNKSKCNNTAMNLFLELLGEFRKN